MKQDGRETFYNAMIKRDLKPVSDTQFKMEVDNLIQVDVINADIDKLVNFIRKSINNYEFSIQVVVTENHQEDLERMSGKEKFRLLSTKYPNLNILKNTFNLDIEY